MLIISNSNKKQYNSSNKAKIRSGSVSSNELFDNYFMRKNTNFLSFSDFLRASGVDLSSQHKFDALSEQELDIIVSAHTEFKSWKEMIDKAKEPYTGQRLRL